MQSMIDDCQLEQILLHLPLITLESNKQASLTSLTRQSNQFLKPCDPKKVQLNWLTGLGVTAKSLFMIT